MTPRRPGLGIAGALLLLVGLGSAVALTLSLGRQVAFEQEKREHSDTNAREGQTRLATAREDLRAARERIDRLEAERENRARIVEGEMAALRRDLAAAVRDRDASAEGYRGAVAERDRAAGDLVAARREVELLRADRARAVERASGAEETARRTSKEAEEAASRLAGANVRVAALLRPLLQDLRSPDGSLRVRAHEALCAFAGRNLPFRPNGTPEEIESDAKAIEAAVMPRAM